MWDNQPTQAKDDDGCRSEERLAGLSGYARDYVRTADRVCPMLHRRPGPHRATRRSDRVGRGPQALGVATKRIYVDHQLTGTNRASPAYVKRSRLPIGRHPGGRQARPPGPAPAPRPQHRRRPHHRARSNSASANRYTTPPTRSDGSCSTSWRRSPSSSPSPAPRSTAPSNAHNDRLKPPHSGNRTPPFIDESHTRRGFDSPDGCENSDRNRQVGAKRHTVRMKLACLSTGPVWTNSL